MNEHNDDKIWAYLWREALVALSLGWNLALPIFGGVLLGHMLDRWLETGLTFTLGLLTLGIGLGYYNLAQFIRRVDRYDRLIARHKKAETADKEAPCESDQATEPK